MNDFELVSRAHEIAFMAHHETGETRGGMALLPYYIHVAQVATDVAKVIPDLPPVFFEPYKPAEIMAAAVLHDVPEDCDPKWLIDIEELSPKVLALSLMLKNGHMEEPPDIQNHMTRAEKKRLDFAKLADPSRVHHAVIPIKYMDRLHNLRTSGHWRKDRQLRYATEETPQLLAVLNDRMLQHGSPFVVMANEVMRNELLAAIEEVKERVK